MEDNVDDIYKKLIINKRNNIINSHRISYHNNSHSGVYNICSDNPVPLKSLVKCIRDMVKPSFLLNFGALQYRPGQCMYMEGDTTKLKNNLYVINTSTYQDRLKETVSYYINKFSEEKINCKN